MAATIRPSYGTFKAQSNAAKIAQWLEVSRQAEINAALVTLLVNNGKLEARRLA